MTTFSHYGVKGMKWGVTRDEAVMSRIAGARKFDDPDRKATDAAYKDYKKTTTRKERRADKKAVRESKANYLIEKAASDKTALLSISLPGSNGLNHVLSGEAFVEYLSNGGSFNPLYSDLYEA